MVERDAQLRVGLFAHVYVRGHGALYLLALPVQSPKLESAARGTGGASRFCRLAKAMPVPPISVNRHDPYAYLKDVLTRLPTQRASEIGQLLPYQWAPG